MRRHLLTLACVLSLVPTGVGVAVPLALNSPQLRIDGLAISFGNNAAEPSTEQARTMVHEVMGRREVPIAQGARAPRRCSSWARSPTSPA